MSFLRRLFGGGGQGGSDSALYLYVRLKNCDEVVRVRVGMTNELSEQDDGTFYVRKLISSSNWRCGKAELHIYFDKNRKLQHSQVIGGEEAKRADYEAWAASDANA